MSKLLVGFLASLFLFFLSGSVAYAVNITVDPSEVSPGQPVTVYINELPFNNGFTHGLNIYDGSLKLSLLSEVIVTREGTCSVRVYDSNSWVNEPICYMNGSLAYFIGHFNTKSPIIDLAELNRDKTYQLVVTEGAISDPREDLSIREATTAFTIKANVASEATFNIDSVTPTTLKPGEQITIELSNTVAGNYKAEIDGYASTYRDYPCPAGTCKIQFTVPGSVEKTSVAVVVTDPSGLNSKQELINITLELCTPKVKEACSARGFGCVNGECIEPDGKVTPLKLLYAESCGVPGKPECTSSEGITCGNGIDTAIGCVPTEPIPFIRGLLQFVLGIAGGIALLMMAFGAVQMISSAGNPETLKAGKDKFKNAIIGVLMIIFSVLLLRILGVDILGLGRFFGVAP